MDPSPRIAGDVLPQACGHRTRAVPGPGPTLALTLRVPVFPGRGQRIDGGVDPNDLGRLDAQGLREQTEGEARRDDEAVELLATAPLGSERIGPQLALARPDAQREGASCSPVVATWIGDPVLDDDRVGDRPSLAVRDLQPDPHGPLGVDLSGELTPQLDAAQRRLRQHAREHQEGQHQGQHR